MDHMDLSRESAAALRSSPAALRNRGPIADRLAQILPPRGLVLEVASGTGEHAVHFAERFPELHWQPSDPSEEALASITAGAAAAGLHNLRLPVLLDVLDACWPVERADALVCINMIHIAPWAATEGLFRGAERLLSPGAPLALYGPFRRNGAHTAPSNAEFDMSLRARNPLWGVRDLEQVTEVAGACGFRQTAVRDMPANNLMVAFERSS